MSWESKVTTAEFRSLGAIFSKPNAGALSTCPKILGARDACTEMELR